MPQEGDEQLTQKESILLLSEKYFDTSIQEMETIRPEEISHEELRYEMARNKEIQTIRKALERGDKEMKGVVLGLCQWKDEHLWYQGKIWVRNKEGIRAQPYTSTPRYSASRTRRNGKNDGAPTTQILLASYTQYNKTIRQEMRHLPKNEGGTTCTLWPDETK